jgi:hypothetical protein
MPRVTIAKSCPPVKRAGAVVHNQCATADERVDERQRRVADITMAVDDSAKGLCGAFPLSTEQELEPALYRGESGVLVRWLIFEDGVCSQERARPLGLEPKLWKDGTDDGQRPVDRMVDMRR